MSHTFLMYTNDKKKNKKKCISMKKTFTCKMYRKEFWECQFNVFHCNYCKITCNVQYRFSPFIAGELTVNQLIGFYSLLPLKLWSFFCIKKKNSSATIQAARQSNSVIFSSSQFNVDSIQLSNQVNKSFMKLIRFSSPIQFRFCSHLIVSVQSNR